MNQLRHDFNQSVERLLVATISMVVVAFALLWSDISGQGPVMTTTQLVLAFAGADVALVAWFELDQKFFRFWRKITRPDRPHAMKVVRPR